MNLVRVGTFAALVFLTACSQEAQPPESGPISVRIVEISADDLAPTRTRTFFGTVAAEHSADLAFEVGGRIIEINVEEGAFVDKGSLLARLEDTDYVAAINAARSDFKAARQNYTRVSELAEEGAESQERVETAKLRLDVARSKLTVSESKLANTRLTAPYDGYIGRRLVDIGDSVVAKQKAMVLLDATPARRIRAIIPETDIALNTDLSQFSEFMDDLQPQVVLSIYPKLKFPAEYVALTTETNPVTRTLTITLRFTPPENLPVIHGTSAKLLIEVPNERAGLVKIPAVAVHAGSGDAQRVWVVGEDDKLVARSVNLERIVGDQAEVGGLAPGDRIVASGVAKLREGDIVTAFER